MGMVYEVINLVHLVKIVTGGYRYKIGAFVFFVPCCHLRSRGG